MLDRCVRRVRAARCVCSCLQPQRVDRRTQAQEHCRDLNVAHQGWGQGLSRSPPLSIAPINTDPACRACGAPPPTSISPLAGKIVLRLGAGSVQGLVHNTSRL